MFYGFSVLNVFSNDNEDQIARIGASCFFSIHVGKRANLQPTYLSDTLLLLSDAEQRNNKFL